MRLVCFGTTMGIKHCLTIRIKELESHKHRGRICKGTCIYIYL